MIIYSFKYYTKYNQIVKHYKDLDLKKSKELYTESHHILPKSMGGTNKKDNLVRVPARVHFLLHWMLYRIYRTSEMAFAWHMMKSSLGNHVRYTSVSFQYIKEAHAIANRNREFSIETRKKIGANSKLRNSGETHPMYGKAHSADSKIKMSIAQKGKTHSIESKLKMSKSRSGDKNAFFGKTHSEETKAKISISAKSRTQNGFFGKTHSEETKAKLRASWERRKAK